MVLIAINTGWTFYYINMCVFYNKSIYNLSGAEIGKFIGFVSIPWNLKPIFGFLSDTFFLFGYR